MNQFEISRRIMTLAGLRAYIYGGVQGNVGDTAQVFVYLLTKSGWDAGLVRYIPSLLKKEELN